MIGLPWRYYLLLFSLSLWQINDFLGWEPEPRLRNNFHCNLQTCLLTLTLNPNTTAACEHILVIVMRFRDYFRYFLNPQIKLSKRKRHANNFLAFIVPESKVTNSHKDNLHETNVLRNKKYVWCGKRRWFLWMSVVCWLLKYITEAHTSTQTLEKKIISQNSIFFLLFLVNSLETFCYNKSRNNLKRRDSDLTLIDLWRKS